MFISFLISFILFVGYTVINTIERQDFLNIVYAQGSDDNSDGIRVQLHAQ
ncbi:MAG: hypothetical protein ACXWFC_02810 [Nitrososphaeraceae archaeon]